MPAAITQSVPEADHETDFEKWFIDRHRAAQMRREGFDPLQLVRSDK